MIEVIAIEVLKPYLLKLSFSDGTDKVVDLLPFIGEGFTKELLDPEYFRTVQIDSGGGIYWPNGYDFCPTFLKEDVPEMLTTNNKMKLELT